MAIHTHGTQRSRSTQQKSAHVPPALNVGARAGSYAKLEEAMLKPLAASAFPSVRFVLFAICDSLSHTRKVIPQLAIAAVLLVLPGSAAHAQEQAAQKQTQSVSASDLQTLYARNFQVPGIAEDMVKNALAFENTAASGRSVSTGIVRDSRATVGLNTGGRSTAAAPVLAPATNVDVNKLPLNVAPLQRQLRQVVERAQRDGLTLRYPVNVFEQAASIKLFSPEDNLRFGPTPGTAPTHKGMVSEMMRIVVPAESALVH